MKTNLIKVGLDLLLRKNPGARADSANPYAGHQLLNQPEYRRHLFHRGKARPILLICETVNICNNDCVVCPYGIMERKKAIMPLPLFQKVLSDYAGMGGGPSR